jgi:predicted RNA-binding protein with PUA-like domain
LFYHSNATPPGVAGLAKVVGEPYPDPTQFDSKSEYHDPKATKENPRWWLVDFEFIGKFPKFVPLEQMKQDAALEGMVVLQKGTRLSITPVDAPHYKRVCKLGGWK